MEKEFIPYEQALCLKELGFEEKCLLTISWTNDKDYITGVPYEPSAYICGETKIKYDFSKLKENHKGGYGFEMSVPLYQQAFRWFRKKHKLQAEILWRGDMGCFCYKTGKFKYGSHDFSKEDFKTYEEAELECLKALIKISKDI